MLSTAAVVVCALNLLGRSSAVAPIKFLASPPPGASRNAEAFIVREPATIYLITSTPAFRAASQGDFRYDSREGCQKIASIIVHEEWHLRYGADERGAYQAQLTALALLGASSPLISSVRQSMLAVLDKSRQPQLLGRYASRND